MKYLAAIQSPGISKIPGIFFGSVQINENSDETRRRVSALDA